MPPDGIHSVADRLGETGGALIEYVNARWEEATYSAGAVWPDPEHSPVQQKLNAVLTDVSRPPFSHPRRRRQAMCHLPCSRHRAVGLGCA